MKNVDYWYVVYCETCKPHFCSSYYLAQTVSADLTKQYFHKSKIGLMNTVERGDKAPFARKFFIDTGTTLVHRNKTYIDLSENIRILWYSEETDKIKNAIQDVFPGGVTDEHFKHAYGKLYGPLNVLCLTVSQSKKLYDCIINGYPGASYL